jgi:hypothetical protein
MGFGGTGTTNAPTASLTKSGSTITITINPQTDLTMIGLQVVGTGTSPTSVVAISAGTVTINSVVYTWTHNPTNAGKVSQGDTITMGTATTPVSIQLVWLPSSNAAATDKQVIGNIITF